MQAPNEAALDRALAGVQYVVSCRLLQVSGNAVLPRGDSEAFAAPPGPEARAKQLLGA